MAGDRALGPAHGGEPGWIQHKYAGAIVDQAAALAETVVAGGDAELVLGGEIRDADSVGDVGRAENESIGAQAASKCVLAAAAADDVRVGIADDRVVLSVAGGADRDRRFEQHQPLDEWAQGVADGAVNPVFGAAVVDPGRCRLADDIVHIVDVVVVVASSAKHGVRAGITVQGVVTGSAEQRIVAGAAVKVIAPPKARDRVVCRRPSEIIVKLCADNVCHVLISGKRG